MEHAGTPFVESVCSDLMTASCCNAVVDFNQAWQWKNLRQSWWLLTSLLGSTIIKSYTVTPGLDHYELLLWTNIVHIFCVDPKIVLDSSWRHFIHLDPLILRDRTAFPIVEQDFEHKHDMPSIYTFQVYDHGELAMMRRFRRYNYSLLSLPSKVFGTFLLLEVRMIYKPHGFFKLAKTSFTS